MSRSAVDVAEVVQGRPRRPHADGWAAAERRLFSIVGGTLEWVFGLQLSNPAPERGRVLSGPTRLGSRLQGLSLAQAVEIPLHRAFGRPNELRHI